MIDHYLLTLIGTDRPGLVESIARTIAKSGGNWEESRLANLRGKFAGMVLAAVPHQNAADFTQQVDALKTAELSVRITRIQTPPSDNRRTRHLRLLANDRPGILHELSAALTSLNANVEELTSDCIPAPMSNQSLFQATCRLSLPDSLADESLIAALENLADDWMVELAPPD
ncbi:MAG: glycine cleavage system protein R [Cellvibrionales bacterium]|nr:glycine cleavage system protein R [Cellvibrionales bacterium]